MNNDLICLLCTSYLNPFEVIRLGSTCKAMKDLLENNRLWKTYMARHFTVHGDTLQSATASLYMMLYHQEAALGDRSPFLGGGDNELVKVRERG